MYIHFQIVAQAVLSLGKILIRRNLPADQFRSQQILSISGNPTVILNPNLSGELPCETLSLETITRWILCEYTYKLLTLTRENGVENYCNLSIYLHIYCKNVEIDNLNELHCTCTCVHVHQEI